MGNSAKVKTRSQKEMPESESPLFVKGRKKITGGSHDI